MGLGAVWPEYGTGYAGPAKTGTQAGKADASMFFAEKLQSGWEKAAGHTGGTAAGNAGDWQEQPPGAGTAAGREAVREQEAVKAAAKKESDAETSEKTDGQTETITDYSAFFQEKINEIFVKIQNGETEPVYQIGSCSFTEKEWNRFLKKFDSVQDAIRKLMREEYAKRAAKKLQRRQAVTEKKTPEKDNSGLLLAPSVSCTYPPSIAGKENIRYVTWYTKEGISCRKMGQTEETEWEISFQNPEQYEKVREFLAQFPDDWNLRFAAHENFWNDFLSGDLDTGRFTEFIKGTDKGVPDYTVTADDGSVRFDRDKIQWAKYLNSFENEFYTAEEFQKKWEMEIAANASKKIKIPDPNEAAGFYTVKNPLFQFTQLYCEYPGGPLYTAGQMERRMREAFLRTGKITKTVL